MADEAANIQLMGNLGDPVEFTVATGTAIPKGTLMKISASNTAIIATAGSIFAGITNEEKTATDGKVKIALLTHCIATLTCGAAETMTFGEPVKVGAAPNEVDLATDDTVEGKAFVVGMAMESVANNAQGQVLINVGKFS